MTTTSNVPAYGRFGGFGGRYVPEALIPALEQLEEVWRKAVVDPEFVGEGRSQFQQPVAASLGR